MRHARILLTTMTLLALALPGCAGTKTTRTAPTLAAAPARTTDALGRLADPDFLFTGSDKRSSNRLKVKAMAYTSCSASGKKKSKRVARGAWGDALTDDVNAVAVSPDLLEMGLDRGDLISIEGLPGQYKVLDVMHGRHDKTIDIFYGDDRCGALQWGKRTLTITWQ
jgi:3D (Asp-Asp-Asp) domain-containing protein